MGTSATVRFKYEGDNPILVNVRHHYDGYIEGVGHELAKFLLSKKIVNGISIFDDTNTIANGFSCLIAQYISNVKKGPGEVYICPQYFKGDYNYDVVYNGYKNEIYIKVTHYDKVLFKGSPKELLEYKEGEQMTNEKGEQMSNEKAFEVVKYLSGCEDVSPYHKEALNILLDDYERIKEAWRRMNESNSGKA